MSQSARITLLGICLGLIVCAAVILIVNTARGDFSSLAFLLVMAALIIKRWK